METEDGTNRSPSRDPLTPEPADPGPQKKKKKKRAPTIGKRRTDSVSVRSTTATW